MSKKRAKRESLNDEVGKKRYELIKNASEAYQKAQDAAYYLEAIAIIESLIADRLESALDKSESTDVGFWTLESLIRKAESSPTLDSDIKEIAKNDVKNWKDNRNKALHEMAKLEEDNLHDWGSRYEKFKDVGPNGYEIFNKLSNIIGKIRKVNDRNG